MTADYARCLERRRQRYQQTMKEAKEEMRRWDNRVRLRGRPRKQRTKPEHWDYPLNKQFINPFVAP